MKNLQDLILRLKNNKGNLIIMIGPPLSGKSTLINDIIEDTECNIISRDNIVVEFGKGKSYADAFTSVVQKDVTKELNQRLKDQSLTENNVIIDMTNLSPKRRREHLRQFPNHTKIALVVGPLKFEELIRRNKIRHEEEGKFIPEQVIRTMYDSYKFPTKEEGFDHIITIR